MEEVEARVADPRVADPRVADPWVADPWVADPWVADPCKLRHPPRRPRGLPRREERALTEAPYGAETLRLLVALKNGG